MQVKMKKLEKLQREIMQMGRQKKKAGEKENEQPSESCNFVQLHV